MPGENYNKDGSLPLAEAIRDVENFFFYEKEGELYQFLLTAMEKPLIENTLHRTKGNQLKTARILGINRNTLRTKIRKLKIDIGQFK